MTSMSACSPPPRKRSEFRPPHPDARLDLQAILHRVYDAAGYRFYIYEGTPSPVLTPDDLAWSRQFVPPATP
jgi:hypothetical protein